MSNEFQMRYARMPDEELVGLWKERNQLAEAARIALELECQRRELQAEDETASEETSELDVEGLPAPEPTAEEWASAKRELRPEREPETDVSWARLVAAYVTGLVAPHAGLAILFGLNRREDKTPSNSAPERCHNGRP